MTYDASGSRGVVPAEDRHWAMGAHLSAFVAAYIALGFLGPLVILLIRGERSPFVRQHAALNFNLTVLIYVVVCVILAFLLIGFLLIIALGILYVVAVLIGAVRANSGEAYRYPLTIRFIK